jgi:hypothetical protein
MICCYRLVRTIRGWRFSFEWKRMVSGGFAYVMPSRLDLEDWRYGVMVAAGPVSNVLLTALLLLAPWPEWAAGARMPALLAAGLITIVSLLPITAGANLSDMARLIALARGGDDWLRWKLVLRFQTLNMQGVPPREWDACALEAAASLPGGRPADRLMANLLGYLAAIDRREFGKAAQFLETTLTISDRVGPAMRAMLFLEAAFFQARRRKDAVLGRAWLAQAGSPKGISKYCIGIAEAGVLFAEGQLADAGKKAAMALSQLKREAPDVATAQLVAGALEEILAEVDFSLATARLRPSASAR